MSTQNQSYSTDERMKRQELQMDDRDDDDETTRDENVIDARGEEVEVSTKPLITPAIPVAENVETRATPQSTAPAEGEKVPNAGFGTPNLPDHDSAQTGQRWQHIQSEFVDDPRKAVGEAHQLVGELVQRIVDGFTRERSDLEAQWSKGDSVSTEDLRVCLQHYREFFSRLVPSVSGTQHS
jgi:hypothetical protein